MILMTTQLDNIRCQFHQHFMRKFFVQTSFRQLFSSTMLVEKAAEKTFVQKILHKMLMKLTTDSIFLIAARRSPVIT